MRRSRVAEMGRREEGATAVKAVSIRARERRDLQRERPPPEREASVSVSDTHMWEQRGGQNERSLGSVSEVSRIE